MPHRAEVAPSRRALTVATALVAADLTLFALIAEDVADGGGLISHDKEVLAWFIDHRTEGLIRAAKLISTIGSFAALAIMGVLLGLVLRRRWRVLACAPLAALVVASLASTTAKALFDRNRPP